MNLPARSDPLRSHAVLPAPAAGSARAPGAAGAGSGAVSSTAFGLAIAASLCAWLATGTAALWPAVSLAAPGTLELVSGAILSLLLSGLAWRLRAAQVHADRQARATAAELHRLAEVARHSHNAVLIIDREARITWVNEGFTQITGYRPDEAIGRPVTDLLRHAGADPEPARLLQAARHAAQCQRVEILHRRKDGSDWWADVDQQPLHEIDGTLSGFLQISADVTARRQDRLRLEAALRDGDALLRTIRSQAIVSETDAQGVITYVNDAFCRISGYTRDDLLGRTHAVLASGQHGQAFWRALWQQIATGQPWRGHICNRARDGRLYWVDSMIAPHADASGQIEKYVSIRVDVTASIEAKRALGRERQRRDQIIEGTDVGTWEWNVETGETVFNERWADMAGRTLASLSPTSIQTWSSLCHPEDLSRASVLLERHFDGAMPGLECEFRMRHRSGHWIWVLTRGKLFSRTADGRPEWMAGTQMDITARKAAEAALRASQAFLDRIGRIARVGGWELEFATGALQLSGETIALLALAEGTPFTLEALMARFVPDARQALTQGIESARTVGIGWDVELPMVPVEGCPRWVRSLGEVVLESGRPARLIGTLQDVTPRRILQDELRRKNDLLEKVLEHLPCGLAVFDGELRLIAHNPQYRTLLGLPVGLFQDGRVRFADLARYRAQRGDHGEGDIDAIVRDREARAQAGSVTGEIEPGSTQVVPLEVRAATMPDGGFVATYTDISERMRAQAQVRRSSELLRAAFETVDEAFVLFGPDDRLVLCNDKYRALYAASAPAIVEGALFEDIIRYGAENGQYREAEGRVDAWVAERLAAHRGSDRAFTQTLQDGRVLRVIERRMPDGHTVGFRIDITDLHRARVAAEQASLAKSQFLANMSHEIRTPMNAVLGMLKLLRRSDLAARQADHAAKAEGAARSLLGLLNDILDFSKVEAGKLELDPHPFHLDDLLAELSVIVAAAAGNKPIELVFDVDDAVPAVLVGDALRLKQVLVNLCGNAVKFTARGEVVLAIRVAHAGAEGIGLAVSVSDTGIGIAPEHLQRIFNGFSQAEASTTRRYGGSGLGLAISERIVALMGGTLQLTSTLGEGSCFSFQVLLPAGSPASLARPPHPSPAPAPAPQALVIDDHALAAAVMARHLAALGWQVTTAPSGADGLACAAAAARAGRPFDAIFVDGGLPDIDALPLAGRLQALGTGAQRIITLGAAADAESGLPGHPMAADAPPGHLVKPVVRAALDRALGLAQGVGEAHGQAPRRLAGLTLLVAEDNANNRQIAFELLSEEGATVRLAHDGAQAVEAVEAAAPAFDAVLMDLQMPVMDGLRATAEIRRRVGPDALPIIAMTANAMPADRAACLAAGMNDHIGKPFDLDRLVDTLRRHVHGAGRAGTDARIDTPAPGDTDVVAAREAPAGPDRLLDLEGALARFGGRRHTYAGAVRAFVDEMADLPQQLAQALADGDPRAAGGRLHACKGIAATVGAVALAHRAGELETELQTGHLGQPDAADLVARWRAVADPTLAALAHASATEAPVALGVPVAAGHAEGAAPPGARAGWRDHLRQLAALLQAGDMQAESEFVALRLRCPADLAGWLQQLQATIERLDYDAALALCQRRLQAPDDPPASPRPAPRPATLKQCRGAPKSP